MKLVTLLIFSTILTTSLFSYDNNQGKIDMHGGKSDSLIPKQGFSQNFQTLGSINEKKTEEEKSDKNFLKIEEIDKIEKEKEKNE